jgi:hypothetical protein
MPTTEERALELARIRDGMLRQEYFLMHRRSAASEGVSIDLSDSTVRFL